MAKKKTKRTKSSKSKTRRKNNNNLFNLSDEKKKKVLGVLLLIVAALLFLSLVSYSRFDKALLNYELKDFIKSISQEDLQSELGSANNWLGVVGAYVADFFMNSTIGIFSLIFPVIIGLWGYSFFQKYETKLLLNITNFLLIMGVLLSTMFGVLRLEVPVIAGLYELSGFVGEYFGEFLHLLLGAAGSIILVSAFILIVMIISFDVKVEKVFPWLKNAYDAVKDFFKKLFARERKTKIKIKDLREEENKSLVEPEKKKPKKEKKKEEKPKKETGINIIKNKSYEDEVKEEQAGLDEDDPGILKNALEQMGKPINKNTRKKVKEVIEENADRDREAQLPEPWEEEIQYESPSLSLLNQVPQDDVSIAESELKRNAELLKDKLALFDIEIEDISVTPGPVVTLYEIVPAPGVKISKIVNLEHDIALALAAKGIRIIAPIPGKSAIGVEIPNKKPSLVVAKSVLPRVFKEDAELPLALGKDIAGDVVVTDLATMPHLLIAGSTGSGKSVDINMMITSLLYAKHPSEVKLAIIDPKKIELSFYRKLSKHFLAVCPDLDENIVTEPQSAVILLKSVEIEMEKRYDKLQHAQVRNIEDYNKKIESKTAKLKDTDDIKHHYMPYIVVIIDELADLMITAAKEVEEPIARLAQLARAVGIHLVVATQRPSVNVITGVIKANFSARIAYQVATKIDSRTILDMNGAETLLGRGDMLFLPGGLPKPVRVQNAFITTEEVEKITEAVYTQQGYSKPYNLPSVYEKKKEKSRRTIEEVDEMFDEAARVIFTHQQGSVSLLQRKLKLGYSRAARIVDQLEDAGIVGPSDGSKAREVLVDTEQQLDMLIRGFTGE